MKNKKKKGFTLIELIVVIAILGILAAVAVPRLTGFTNSGRKSAVTADSRTILTSLQALATQGTTITGLTTASSTLTDLTGPLSGTLSNVTGDSSTAVGFTYVKDGWSVICNAGVLAAPAATP